MTGASFENGEERMLPLRLVISQGHKATSIESYEGAY